ncbi:TOMM precursor leader peptide-binding protein, partial [Yinghuangia seranimata]|uniref:TOMM precursor leader peptide-binding protein n=1 Tax=Yinghuangia seranimata TaxID=408067 RepID=UPI00248D0EB9
AAALLAAAGVGTVEVRDRRLFGLTDATPAGPVWDGERKRRETAAREAVRRAAPATRCVRPATRPLPDVALVVPEGHPDPGLARRLTARGVPHLFADVRETTGLVGPLVLPGRTPCAHCLDLARADRDPAWPRLLAQLAAPGPGRSGGAAQACDTVLATAVAAHAALHLLAHLDGDRPAAVGGVLELTLPYGAVRRRTWDPHPDCGCGAHAAVGRPAPAPYDRAAPFDSRRPA